MESLGSILPYFILVTWIIKAECSGMLKAVQDADLGADAQRINEAFGKWNTDDNAFLEILPFRGCQQRSEIYQKLDPEKRQNKSEHNYMSGDVYIAIMSCYFCGPDYYNMWMRHAIKEDDKNTLIEILVLLSFDDPTVKEKVLNSQSLIKNDDSSDSEESRSMDTIEYWRTNCEGDFGNWGIEMMTKNRDTNTEINEEKAKTDAEALIGEMNDGFGDNRQKLDYILAELSVEQAKLTLEEFQKANENKDLVDEIKNQLGDEMQKAYLDLITHIREGKNNYLAIRFNEMMAGMGTDEKNLSRLVIFTAESELVEVNNAYQQKYGKSIADSIRDETSGFQQKFLLAFMGESP